MKLIIGLGNPGKKYQNTRHNIGFIILDALINKLNLKWEKNKKIKSLVVKFFDLIFLKPETFMNFSGKAVAAAMSYYKISPDDIIVIHDDLDIIIGNFKIKKNSSAGGHNGVQSIIDELGTKNFKRIKIGVEMIGGRQKRQIPGDKFVLENFTNDEMTVINKIIPEIIKILLSR